MKIVYMGTPGFAVAPLKKLVETGYDVVAVITMPDKPAGRGQTMHESEVKKYATSVGLKVLQPEKLKNHTFLEELASLQPDLGIVVAFRMLPEIVWQMPKLGTFNLHASLLPNYRGAAPINHAIINGDTETGVSTFFLKHEIDTGDILMQEKVDILPTDNAGTLHDKLMQTGAELVLKTVKSIENKSYTETPQAAISEKTITQAPKIFKDFCLLNFDNEAYKVHNLVRGLSPYPTAYTILNGKTMKIYGTEIVNKIPDVTPGNIATDGKTYLHIACKDAWLSLTDIQIEGKKRMSVEDFLRGYRFLESDE